MTEGSFGYFGKNVVLTVLLSVIWSAGSVKAEPATDHEAGLRIAREHKQRDAGWQDSQSTITMTIRAANGKERRREVAVSALEVQDDGDKSLLVFKEPKDVSGTAFLSFSHIEQPDDQWIYLPALKRVKRIASKNKSGAFLGSEFAYEDLSSFEVEKYDFRYLGEETINGLICYVLEMLPRDPYSGYSRTVSWIDQEAYRFQKIDFYDRKHSLLKTMTLYGYALYQDRYWRAGRSTMKNHQTGKVTEMQTNNLRFGTGLDDNDFSHNSLKRAR